MLREESSAPYLTSMRRQPAKAKRRSRARSWCSYREPRGQVTLWYRTSDPAARVEIVAESGRQGSKGSVVRFALVDSSLEIRRPAPTAGAIPSRGARYPRSSARLPVIGGGAR